MNADLKSKWVEALRSGKYHQGETYLRSAGDCWCCIGVLVDVTGYQWPPLNSARGYAYGHDYRGLPNTTMPLPSQQAELGISYDHVCELVSMNDGSRKFSFARIADWIELNIPVDAS